MQNGIVEIWHCVHYHYPTRVLSSHTPQASHLDAQHATPAMATIFARFRFPALIICALLSTLFYLVTGDQQQKSISNGNSRDAVYDVQCPAAAAQDATPLDSDSAMRDDAAAIAKAHTDDVVDVTSPIPNAAQAQRCSEEDDPNKSLTCSSSNYKNRSSAPTPAQPRTSPKATPTSTQAADNNKSPAYAAAIATKPNSTKLVLDADGSKSTSGATNSVSVIVTTDSWKRAKSLSENVATGRRDSASVDQTNNKGKRYHGEVTWSDQQVASVVLVGWPPFWLLRGEKRRIIPWGASDSSTCWCVSVWGQVGPIARGVVRGSEIVGTDENYRNSYSV